MGFFKKIIHEADPKNWGVTKKIGHEIDKHVFNGQWTKGWRQGVTLAGIAVASVLTGGAASGALAGTGALGGASAAAGYAAAAGVAAGAYGAKQGHDTYVAGVEQAKAEAEANAAAAEAERQATEERTAQLRGLKKQLVPTMKGSAYKGAANEENVSGIVLG